MMSSRNRNPDIVILGHPQQALAGKIDRIKAGERPHPLLLQPGEWAKQVDAQEAAFLKRLETEKAKQSSR
jgi:hypothetical protein